MISLIATIIVKRVFKPKGIAVLETTVSTTDNSQLVCKGEATIKLPFELIVCP